MTEQSIADLEAQVVADISIFLVSDQEMLEATVEQIEENSILAGKYGDENLAKQLLRHPMYGVKLPEEGNHQPHPLTIARYFENLADDKIKTAGYPFSNRTLAKSLVHLADAGDVEGFTRLASAYFNWERMGLEFTGENEPDFRKRVIDNLLGYCRIGDTLMQTLTLDLSLNPEINTKTQLYFKANFKLPQ